MLAHSCHQAHTNLGQAFKTPPLCAARDAQEQPAVPWEGSATTQEDKMSVFGNIVSAIFGSKHAAGVTAAAGSSSPPASSRTTSASAAPAGATAAAAPAGAPAAKPIS